MVLVWFGSMPVNSSLFLYMMIFCVICVCVLFSHSHFILYYLILVFFFGKISYQKRVSCFRSPNNSSLIPTFTSDFFATKNSVFKSNNTSAKIHLFLNINNKIRFFDWFLFWVLVFFYCIYTHNTPFFFIFIKYFLSLSLSCRLNLAAQKKYNRVEERRRWQQQQTNTAYIVNKKLFMVSITVLWNVFFLVLILLLNKSDYGRSSEESKTFSLNVCMMDFFYQRANSMYWYFVDRYSIPVCDAGIQVYCPSKEVKLFEWMCT